MNYNDEKIKYCIECGKPFLTRAPQQKICSRTCEKGRAKRTYQHKSKANYYKDGFLELRGIKDIEQHKKKISTGQKVIVYQGEGKKSIETRYAKILECYKHHSLCQLKNYKESFAYADISVIKQK